jgi:hypothetical protein
VAVVALVSSALLWQKLSTIQEHLARQSADAGAQSIEARALAKQAQDLARETAARQAVTDTRLGEVALQRTQLEDLMQSLSRSRDENLVVDIESAVRLAQQQAQLTGSVEPLLAALRTADQRIARAAQPRLARLRTPSPATWTASRRQRDRHAGPAGAAGRPGAPDRRPAGGQRTAPHRPGRWRASDRSRRKHRPSGGSAAWRCCAKKPATWCA